MSKKNRSVDEIRKKRSSREAADRIKREYERKERRKNILIYSGVAVVALALVGGAVWGVRQEKEAVAAPIEGLAEVEDQSRDHVVEPIVPAALPPTGGDHSATVQNCGVYTQPVAGENAVHSLEHGAVWLTYRPGLSEAEVSTLDQYTNNQTHMLVTPYPDLAAPVVATAWGKQLELQNADDPRLERFVKKYLESRQAPEPGAPCSGGTGSPA